jgi:PAS domain-containing protein
MSDDSIRNETVEEQLSTILESIGDGFCTFDMDWRFIYFNSTAEKISELTGTNLSARNSGGLLTLYTRLEKEFRLAATGEIRSFENLTNHRDDGF